MDDFSTWTVSEIRSHFLDSPRALRRGQLKKLRLDPRKGVQAIAQALARRRAAEQRERRRLSRMLEFEQDLWRKGVRRVAGVDEAGVGPLAGPVVAAAVIFPPGTRIAEIDDSKKIEASRRLELAQEIEKKAEAVAVASVDVESIDRINIYHAALLAMRRAVSQLAPLPEFLLVDAREIGDLAIEQRCLVQGDTRCFSIAAASIIAKTHRDRIMESLDRAYPDYGFAEHKGYFTTRHCDAIRRCGISPVHRRSFSVLEEILGHCSDDFYHLRDCLEQANSGPELAAAVEEFQGRRKGLTGAESRKIQLLIRRRKKSLSG